MAKKQNAKEGLFINYVIWLAVGVFDYLNSSVAMYARCFAPALSQISYTLPFILFPIYTINTGIYTLLALINLLLDRDKDTHKIKKENLIRFLVNLFTTLVVSTAVIGLLVFSAAMGMATSFLFAANLGVTFIYNMSGAIYHFKNYYKKGKLLKSPDLPDKNREILIEERKNHLGSGIGYSAVGFTIALVIIASSCILIGGYIPLASLGIISGIIGATFCMIELVKAIRNHKKENTSITPEDKNDSTAKFSTTAPLLKKLHRGLIKSFSYSFNDFIPTTPKQKKEPSLSLQEIVIKKSVVLPRSSRGLTCIDRRHR